MSGRFMPPRLLVSVRSPAEAQRALAGGADIIDVKDPGRGSLGRAEDSVIRQIAALPALRERRNPLSIALGEVDHVDAEGGGPLPASATFAKIGLAGLRGSGDWVARWRSVREDHDRRSGRRLRWIAVIYADELAARSPSPEAILTAATETVCGGVLVDTFDKSDGSLLDCVPLDHLAAWARFSRDHGLLFAVAGRLSLQEVPRVCSIAPDVVAVRSAVCRREDRRAEICIDRVAALKRALRQLPAALQPTATRG